MINQELCDRGALCSSCETSPSEENMNYRIPDSESLEDDILVLDKRLDPRCEHCLEHAIAKLIVLTRVLIIKSNTLSHELNERNNRNGGDRELLQEELFETKKLLDTMLTLISILQIGSF